MNSAREYLEFEDCVWVLTVVPLASRSLEFLVFVSKMPIVRRTFDFEGSRGTRRLICLICNNVLCRVWTILAHFSSVYERSGICELIIDCVLNVECWTGRCIKTTLLHSCRYSESSSGRGRVDGSPFKTPKLRQRGNLKLCCAFTCHPIL